MGLDPAHSPHTMPTIAYPLYIFVLGTNLKVVRDCGLIPSGLVIQENKQQCNEGTFNPFLLLQHIWLLLHYHWAMTHSTSSLPLQDYFTFSFFLIFSRPQHIKLPSSVFMDDDAFGFWDSFLVSCGPRNLVPHLLMMKAYSIWSIHS